MNTKSAFMKAALTLCVLLFATALALAQAGGGYELTGQAVSSDTTLDQTGGQYNLTWTSLSSGGLASGGGYELASAIGQAAAGASGGGAYALTGGFLYGQGGGSLLPIRVYLPVILSESEIAQEGEK